MPEYVYALHDFLPEHEDEISFRAGEPIEVIEKDDLYSDGWWQVRSTHYYLHPYARAVVKGDAAALPARSEAPCSTLACHRAIVPSCLSPGALDTNACVGSQPGGPNRSLSPSLHHEYPSGRRTGCSGSHADEQLYAPTSG